MDVEKAPPAKSFELEASGDDRTWGMLAHLSYFLTFVVGLSFIAPLIIWIIKKDTSAFVEDQAKEALNFQLSVLITSLVLVVTICASPLLLVVLIMSIVYSIQGSMAANPRQYGGESRRTLSIPIHIPND